jgi:hypothetical protein
VCLSQATHISGHGCEVSIDHDGSQIAALMRKYHIELLTLAADDADTTLGIDAAFDLEATEVQDVLDTLGKLIRNVADTTRADVQRLTGQAAEHGWSPADLAREIRALGEIASQTRAELIARTEAAAAYSRGSLLRYAQSGQVSGTEWLLGPEPCEICQPLGGTVAALGKSFAEGIDSPPAHPRCTCAISPVLKE